LQAFKKTPFLELAACAVIIGFHAPLASRPMLMSDALFLEGAALSVVGGITACRIPQRVALPSRPVAKEENGFSSQDRASRPISKSFLNQKNGLRILLVGLILIGAAVVIGELLVGLAS